MFTLFQITTLDNWAVIVRPIVEGPQPMLLFFFICYIFLGTSTRGEDTCGKDSESLGAASMGVM